MTRSSYSMTRFSRAKHVPEHDPDTPLLGHLSIVSGSPWKRHGHFVHTGEEPEKDEVVLDNNLYYDAPCTSILVKAKKITVDDEFADMKVVVLIANEIDIDARLAGKHVAIIADKVNISAEVCAKYLYLGTSEIFEDVSNINAYRLRKHTYKTKHQSELVKTRIAEELFTEEDLDMTAQQSAKFVKAVAMMIEVHADAAEDATEPDTSCKDDTQTTDSVSLGDSAECVPSASDAHETNVTPATTVDAEKFSRQTSIRFDAVDDADTDEELDMPDLFLIGKGGSIDGKIKPTVVTDSSTTVETTEQNKQTVTTRRRSK